MSAPYVVGLTLLRVGKETAGRCLTAVPTRIRFSHGGKVGRGGWAGSLKIAYRPKRQAETLVIAVIYAFCTIFITADLKISAAVSGATLPGSPGQYKALIFISLAELKSVPPGA